MPPIHYYFSMISNFIPLIVGLKLYRNLDRNLKVLLCFISIKILTDAIVSVVALHQLNNMWLFHIYTLIEYTFLTFILSNWQQVRFSKDILRISILLFALIWVISKFTFENFAVFDKYTSAFSSTLLTGFSLLTLFHIMKDNLGGILHDHRFWVSFAILLYSAGNFFTFALATLFLWSPHNIIHFLSNLCYTGGFLSKRQQQIY
ncbi:hypothetical protein GF337_12065 [candidate division KSB1 bacterium]|nr:hypothetical protein [candidate division KSB1 bacterium]